MWEIINNTPNLFLFIGKASFHVRLLVIGVAISSYGLILYQLLPEYFRDPVSTLLYFVSPSAVTATIGLLLPKIFSKVTDDRNLKSSSSAISNTNKADDSFQSSVILEGAPYKFQKSMTSTADNKNSAARSLQNGATADNGVNFGRSSSGQTTNADQNNTASSEEFSVGEESQQRSAALDEKSLEEITNRVVDAKNKPLADEISSIKNNFDSLRNDLQNLSSLFETSLTDLKAFQAEMVNPMNFMRKYFQTLDITNLSDPTHGLPNIQVMGDKRNAPADENLASSSSSADDKGAEKQYNDNNNTMEQQNETRIISDKSNPGGKATASNAASTIGEGSHVQLSGNSGSSDDDNSDLSLRQILGKTLTLGKMMAMVSIVDEILKTAGPDGIDLLVAQYRMLGLQTEDENTIYNISTMLQNSKMSPDDVMMMLYKFGQVMGINDKEADLQYTKMISKKIKNVPEDSGHSHFVGTTERMENSSSISKRRSE